MIKTEVFETINRNAEIYNRNKKAKAYIRQNAKRKAERKEDIRFLLGILIGVPMALVCAYGLVVLMLNLCVILGNGGMM